MAYFKASEISIIKGDDHNGLTAIAIDADKNSQFAVRWAVDHLLTKSTSCVLVHVQCKTMHPGDHDSSMSKEGRPPTQQELQQFFLPFRGFCARRGIKTKERVLHDIDVTQALVDYIVHNNVANIVVGASHRNALTRKFKHPDVPSSLMKSAPETCAVYSVSKGKVQTFRLASRPLPATSFVESDPIVSSDSKSSLALKDFADHSLDSPHSDQTSQVSLTESMKSENFDILSRSGDSFYESKIDHSGFNLKPILGGHFSEISSSSSSALSPYGNIEFSSASTSSNNNSEQYIDFLDSEMRRLKLELQQSMDTYNSASKDVVTAKHAARDLHRLHSIEKQKPSEAQEAANRIAELERQKKMIAETKAHHATPDKPKNMENVMSSSDMHCRRYTIQEIEEATNHFSPENKIGEGGYGPVFKGTLNHFPVAIKILRPNISQGFKQFKQEVDVLSTMRHPHMVILLGACPEYGCLVYEYMEMGSLEDRLYRKDNSPPLHWRARFRIAYEIATALLFLHETKPEPLVHRDLKPANILLDYNLVSKIADVGLARLVPPRVANNLTEYHMTAAAGTFFYIDPEYQQTGMLGVKSDLYSFGVVLLQLLTGRPPMGLSYGVESAIENGKFAQALDPTVKNWPMQEALAMAKIALKCCELRKKDRPDLARDVLPLLRKLRDLAVSRDYVEHETVIPFHGPANLVSDELSGFK